MSLAGLFLVTAPTPWRLVKATFEDGRIRRLEELPTERGRGLEIAAGEPGHEIVLLQFPRASRTAIYFRDLVLTPSARIVARLV